MEQVVNEASAQTAAAENQPLHGLVNTLPNEDAEKARQVFIIDLDAISISRTNGIFRRPNELTKEALSELTASIRQYGVIQPVLLRPEKDTSGKFNGKFILICGERRYRSCLLAEIKDIPAYVVDVTDEVALILQITENIQRKDVHPLNEAKGYKLILEADVNITTAELALRFGKSETYILQRLKLNDLVKEAKKDFYGGKMLLGHAIILCRLLPRDQKEILENYRDRDYYGTVADLEDHVARTVMCNLSTAPFDKEDAELYKKAGACMTCVKRSGASPLLFPEIREKDNCLDRGCFFAKWGLFLVMRVRKAIETEPDVVFLKEGYSEPDEKITKMLDEYKLKVLKQYDDFNTYESEGAKVKGLWVTGTKAGHISVVFLKKAAKTVPQGPEGIPVQIEMIKHRMERKRELDGEKVYAKILEALKVHPSQKKNFGEKMIPDEEVMLWFIIYDKGGYHIKDELRRVLGVSKDDPEKMYNAVKTLKAEDRAFILRRVILDQYGGNYPDSIYGFIIRKIAAGYGDIDIAGFEREQRAICEKREIRARERIADLKRTSKVLEESKDQVAKKKIKNKKASMSNKKRG